jgi:hypothetical protein
VASAADRWKSTAETAEAVGVSVATLGRLKASGFFREGRHYVRARPKAKAGPLRWNVDLVTAAMGLA